jgi:hypothetical protein
LRSRDDEAIARASEWFALVSRTAEASSAHDCVRGVGGVLVDLRVARFCPMRSRHTTNPTDRLSLSAKHWSSAADANRQLRRLDGGSEAGEVTNQRLARVVAPGEGRRRVPVVQCCPDMGTHPERKTVAHDQSCPRYACHAAIVARRSTDRTKRE